MSYTLNNLFSVADDNLQSYFFETENDTKYDHHHGLICDNGYKFTLCGARHLLKMPALSSFELSFQLKYEQPFYLPSSWAILFSYDKRHRTGLRVSFHYHPGVQELTISLESLDSLHHTTLASQHHTANLESETFYDASLTVSQNECCGCFAGVEYRFPLESVASGILGFEDMDAIAPMHIRNWILQSSDNLQHQTIFNPITVHIPAVNGNVHPYNLKLSVLRYDNCDYDELHYELTGGLAQREPEEFFQDIWCFSDEHINDLFIRIINGNRSEKLYLWNELGVVMDPLTFPVISQGYRTNNIAKDIPMSGHFPVSRFAKNALFTFGYGRMKALGACAHSDEHEFLFDQAGTLIWDGALLDNQVICEVKSNPFKKMVSLIPKEIPRYEAAVAHAAGNHYFFDDESIDFTLQILTTYASDVIQVQGRIETVYGGHLLTLTPVSADSQDSYIGNMNACSWSVSVGSMPLGVYHATFDIMVAGQVVHTHTSAFEVFSEGSQQSPQEAAGLPHIHCGDGGPGLMKNSMPDPWNTLRDESFIHYVDCVLFDPVFSENSQVWKLLKLYRRKWFVWFTKRSIGSRNALEYPNCLKHADYLNLYYPNLEGSPNYMRFDLWRHSVYTPAVLEVLSEFLKERTDLAAILSFPDVKKEFTNDMLNKLMDVCASEWFVYADKIIFGWFLQQWDELKVYNPTMKRSSYGPFGVYGTSYKSAYFMKFEGLEPKEAHRVIDGFYQLEDYPFSCTYNCSIGAWVLATCKLYCPDLVIRPELYGNFELECIDGFVAWAHPPIGYYIVPAYTLATQVLEYAFNTAHWSNGEMQYWHDNSFQWFQLSESNHQERMALFLDTWRQIRTCVPKKPVRTVAFVADFIGDEDHLSHDIHHDAVYNYSEANVSYLNLVCRESGIPAGFATDFSGLISLDATQVDMLVLPSLLHASEAVIEKIETLHQQGVALFATSDVTGLEHIFGVEFAPDNCVVSQFSNSTQTENILPIASPFKYRPIKANVLLTADEDHPVLLCNGRAVLLNTCVSRAGVDTNNPSTVGRDNVSVLLKESCINIFRTLTQPQAITAPNNGLVFFEGMDGNQYLLVTDYVRWNADKVDWTELKEKMVTIYSPVQKLIAMDNFETVPCVMQKDGSSLCRILLHPAQSRLFRLEK